MAAVLQIRTQSIAKCLPVSSRLLNVGLGMSLGQYGFGAHSFNACSMLLTALNIFLSTVPLFNVSFFFFLKDLQSCPSSEEVCDLS